MMKRNLQAKVFPASKGHWYFQPRPGNKQANFVYWACAIIEKDGGTQSWTVFFYFDEEPDGSKDIYLCDIAFVAPDVPEELQESNKKINLFVGDNELVGQMEII